MSTQEQGTSRNISRRALLGGAAVLGGAGAVGAWQFRDRIDFGASSETSTDADDPGEITKTTWGGRYGNPGLTGYTPDPGPVVADVAHIRWTSSSGRVISSPIVADDTVYALGVQGSSTYLYALDIASGGILWNLDFRPLIDDVTNEGLVRELPLFASVSVAMDGDMMFVVEKSGLVAAINVVEREFVWHAMLPWPVNQVGAGEEGVPAGLPSVAMPIVANGRLQIVANDFVLHALDITDGSEAWSFPLGFSADEPCTSQPVVIGDFVGIMSGTEMSPYRMFMLDAATGDEHSRVARDNDADVEEDRYSAGRNGVLMIFGGMITRVVPTTRADSESPLLGNGIIEGYAYPVPNRQPVVGEDAVYLVSDAAKGTSTITRVDYADKDKYLEFNVPDMTSELVAGMDTLFFVSNGNDESPPGLYAYDGANGEERWCVEFEEARNNRILGMAVYGDKVIVSTSSGMVAVFAAGESEDVDA